MRFGRADRESTTADERGAARIRTGEWRICNPLPEICNPCAGKKLQNGESEACTNACTACRHAANRGECEVITIDADLATLISAWEVLDVRVRGAILTLVEAAGTAYECRAPRDA